LGAGAGDAEGDAEGTWRSSRADLSADCTTVLELVQFADERRAAGETPPHAEAGLDEAAGGERDAVAPVSDARGSGVLAPLPLWLPLRREPALRGEESASESESLPDSRPSGEGGEERPLSGEGEAA